MVRNLKKKSPSPRKRPKKTPMKSAAVEATELALGASLCEALLLADGARRLTHQGSSY